MTWTTYDDALRCTTPAPVSAAPPGRSAVRAVEEVPRPRSGARRWSSVLQALGQARAVLGGRAGEVARAAAPRLDLRPRPCGVAATLDVCQLGCGQDRRVSPYASTPSPWAGPERRFQGEGGSGRARGR